VQQQPSSQQVLQHSQQAWSNSRHFSSPLVQVILQPFFVYSQWQWPQAKLHWQTVMPLYVQQQLQPPPASILQRLCSVAVATSSSQRQVRVNPPSHLANFSSQRGTTHHWPGAAAGEGAPPICHCQCGEAPAWDAWAERSVNTALEDMTTLLSLVASGDRRLIKRLTETARPLNPWRNRTDRPCQRGLWNLPVGDAGRTKNASRRGRVGSSNVGSIEASAKKMQ
jgi:hypothetical protein